MEKSGESYVKEGFDDVCLGNVRSCGALIVPGRMSYSCLVWQLHVWYISILIP